MSSIKNIHDSRTFPDVCRRCNSKPCMYNLQVQSIMGCIRVLNKYMAVSLECPLLLKDEYWIRELLFKLSPWDLDLQRISALESEWNSGNYGELFYSFGNPVIESIDYILQKWRLGKCTIIGLKPGQNYPFFLKSEAPIQ